MELKDNKLKKTEIFYNLLFVLITMRNITENMEIIKFFIPFKLAEQRMENQIFLVIKEQYKCKERYRKKILSSNENNCFFY